jgi:hypothetical protein
MTHLPHKMSLSAEILGSPKWANKPLSHKKYTRFGEYFTLNYDIGECQ